MTTGDKPASTVTVAQLRNGRWGFVLKFRGITYPVQGQFATKEQAEMLRAAALHALEQPKQR